MNTIFVYTITRGDACEVVAVSKDIEVLRKRMRVEVENFVDEVYGDLERCWWLIPLDSDPDFWSDEDKEYPTEFHIFETELM